MSAGREDAAEGRDEEETRPEAWRLGTSWLCLRFGKFAGKQAPTRVRISVSTSFPLFAQIEQREPSKAHELSLTL